ncbi:hypothetical protein D3C76_1039630 [compost metagenome]
MHGDEVAEQGAQHEHAGADEEAEPQALQGRRLGLLVGDALAVFLDHQLAVAGQGGVAATEARQQGAHQYGQGVGDHHGGHHARQQVGAGHLQGAGEDLHQRHGAGAHAAPHDGQADEQHRILEAVPHQGADQADAQQRQRHASQDHRQVAHGGVFQQGAAHAEHRAGHQAGDEEVQKAPLLHEAGDHLTRLGRQYPVLEQGGSAEDGEYGATPQVLPYRGDPFAQLAQQGAEHEHQRQGADHAERQ